MAIQGFFTGDVKIRDLNGVLKAVDGIVEVATDAGTVTSVGLTVGSTGTDVNVANSPVTTSGNITLNLPTASATNRGLLSSADWTTFNSKQGTITLTTTGSSGAATLIGTTLNIPNYSGALTGYVPYTGATGNVDLGEYGLDTGFLNFDTTPTGTPTTQGTVYWDDSRSTLSLIMNGVTQHIGQDSFFYVKNSTGSSIPKGTSVMFNGTDGASGHLLIAPFLADGTYPSSYFMGVTAETIGNGGFGQVVNFGELEGINTSAYTAGDLLYASSTVAGGFQTTAPSAPNNIVLIAAAVNSKNNGAIVVRPTYGSNINDDEGVLITSAANNQGLFYDSATGLWKNKSIATVLGYTPANAATTLTINGTTYDISANRTWSVGTVTSVGTSGPLTGGTITGSGTIGITQSSAASDGYLSNTDWATFNNKQTALNGTGFVKISGTTISYDNSTYYLASNPSAFIALTALSATAPLSYDNTTGVFSISQATTSTNGYLSSTDWNTFNNKQAAGNYITALTGEATASGPGSASVTLSTSAVTGKILTGLNLTGGGTIADTDSILQAFGKVQNQISGLAGGVTYQGVWNASTNTPTLTSSVGTKGYYYIVDVAGSTNLNGITDWKVGDWAIFNGSTWDKVDNTDAVSSVNGFTGAVSLTTSNIAEGTNLYYLDSRARLALSFTAGSGAYDNTTGVITIPTNTSQLTNGANYITLSSLSASSPLSYNSGTGAFSIQVANGSQNGYLSSTDWTTFNSKQNAITLTTTGSSGSSTLVGATLNVPTYTLSGLGGVPTSRQLTINGTAYDLSADRSWSVGTHTGSLTSGYIPKATGTTSLTDSLVYDTGSAVLIGTQTASSGKFMVYSTSPDNHYQAVGSAPSFRFADTITSPSYTGIVGLATASNHFIIGAAAGDMVLSNNTTSAIGNFLFGTGATERMRISPSGNVSINNTNNTYRFDVNGTVRFTGQLRLESTITDGTYTYTLPSATGTLALVGGAGVGTVTSIATTGPITGGTITSTGTIGITQATGSTDGYLSSTDWTTFNNKQSSLTNPVTGTGTTNYLPKFTGTSTIGNSQIFDNGTNVGIGTATPSYKLEIYNAAGASAVIGAATGKIYVYGDDAGGTVGTLSSIPLRFATNGTERMRLDASGNLGLGVNPSAWNLAGLSVMQIKNGFIYGYSNETSYGVNAYYNGSNWIYISNGEATRYGQNTGVHAWYTAPSGTAGNAISFTQAMTLDASGRLGIGTTSPSAVLEVAGTSANTDFRISRTVSASTYFYISAPGGTPSTATLGVNGTSCLQLNSTGAATFSSSVTAGGLVTINKQNEGLILTAGANTDASYMSTRANNSTGWLIIGSQGSVGGYIQTGTGANESAITTVGAYALALGTNQVERMRITSGGTLLVGTTSTTGLTTGSSVNVGISLGGGVISSQVNNNSNQYWSKASGYTSGDFTAHFVNGSYVGGISTNGSSTTYATASDYRLKTDLKDFNGLDLLTKIKTYDYEWKADKTRSYGVIAHELQSIINNAVTGVKDGERMQGVDYSKIVPVLIKAVQEQQQQIEQLKNK